MEKRLLKESNSLGQLAADSSLKEDNSLSQLAADSSPEEGNSLSQPAADSSFKESNSLSQPAADSSLEESNSRQLAADSSLEEGACKPSSLRRVAFPHREMSGGVLFKSPSNNHSVQATTPVSLRRHLPRRG